jgi:hypothetical protein
MSYLNESVSQVLEDYNEGCYTLGETSWRLLLLVDEAEQIDTMIALLPREFAAAWTAWAQRSYGGEKAEYISLSAGPFTGREKLAINVVRSWLARHADFRGKN